jgi:DNA-binding GntR family transcriptional regulator
MSESPIAKLKGEPASRVPMERIDPPPSLAEHVAAVLREDILSGRLVPSTRVTEMDVIERTGVSRTPVREGLRRLEAEGLVVSYRGRGTYVAYRLSAQEAILVYDCRLILEPYLTRLAAERLTADELAVIRGLLDRFCDAIEDADSADAVRLDADFHLAIYEAAASELIGIVRGYWARIQLELSEHVYRAELPRRFVPEHVQIFEALERGDGKAAAETMSAHLTHGRRALGKALARPAGGKTPRNGPARGNGPTRRTP